MDDTAANDNQRTPEQQKVVDSVLRARELSDAAAAPSPDYLERVKELARRQRVGGNGPVPANDNKGWPLAEQLRREGNEVLLGVAERYRHLYDIAHTEAPLIGTMPDDTYSVEQRHSINSKTGKLKNDGPRRARHQEVVDDGTYKVVAIDDEIREEVEGKLVTFPRKPAKPITRKWKGDNLIIAAIDAKKLIWRLQDALGPLREIFEDAVLHGETLSSIGERRGAHTKTSGAAGKVLVMLGLEAVQREFHRIDRNVA